jgi:hypothetical protein
MSEAVIVSLGKTKRINHVLTSSLLHRSAVVWVWLMVARGMAVAMGEDALPHAANPITMTNHIQWIFILSSLCYPHDITSITRLINKEYTPKIESPSIEVLVLKYGVSTG